MTEVQANLSFDELKIGDRIQVDIHHPRVAALVAAGYLRVIWKEPDGRGLDGAVDPAGAGGVPGAGVVDGAADPEEEEVDGSGEHQPDEEDSLRAQGD